MALKNILFLAISLAQANSLQPNNDNSGSQKPLTLAIPTTAHGASINHSPSYSSFSFEPAFWVEFFGTASKPNQFTFSALSLIHKHGGRPNIRPGGITMDSMIFSPEAGDPVRTTNKKGGVYRTTVGPAYYQSWGNFPKGTEFIATLNFGNESLDIARDMAVASVRYQPELVKYFELGNEPTNYNPARWQGSTEKYIAQWKEYTTAIDAAINTKAGGASTHPNPHWWASSATTDITHLHVRPADLIPLGINSANQVSQYSIHSYAFATCDPQRAALATIPNILNHAHLLNYADTEILPSAKAALEAGSSWIIGEFNSIACSGNPDVSDTFAQALWHIDTELIYAVRNASACYLHQGATLLFQSARQINTPDADGKPGFSTYDMLYPISTNKRGPQRVLPSFAGILFLAETFAIEGTRVRALDVARGDYFSAYAFYIGDTLSKLALINMRPYYRNSAEDFTVSVDVFAGQEGERGKRQAWVKRMTAPTVDEKDSRQVKWAGQTFRDAKAEGSVVVEDVGRDGVVKIRGSEAVLVFFDKEEAFGVKN